MAAVASPYFDDPQLGAIAANMFTALRGPDPEAEMKRRYYEANAAESDAHAGVYNAQQRQLGISNNARARLPMIFQAERGTLVPGTRTPYDADPNAVTEGDMSTGSYMRPPTADEAARLQGEKMLAYMGASNNPLESAKAELAMTAKPFLLSHNTNDQMTGLNLLEHPLGDNQSVNEGQQREHAGQDYAKATGVAGINAASAANVARINQGAENWRAQLPKPIIISQDGTAVVPKNLAPYYPGADKNGVIHGQMSKSGVQGAAGLDILQRGPTPNTSLVFNPPTAGGGGRGRGTQLKQGEIDKIRLDALSTVKGATTQSGTKHFINKDFVDAVGPERMRAGEAAMNEALKFNATPAEAADAFREAAGLNNSTFAKPSWWQSGTGLTDNNGAPAANTPAAAPSHPTQIPPEQRALGTETDSQYGRLVWTRDDQGNLGWALKEKKAGEPTPPPATTQPPPMQPPQTQGARTLAPPPDSMPTSAQVFAEPPPDKAPPSIHQARKASPYVPTTWDYTDLGQAQRDAGDVTLDPAQRTAANRAVSRLQGVGEQKRPTEAAPLPTKITSQKMADLVLSNPKLYANMVEDAKAWNAKSVQGSVMPLTVEDLLTEGQRTGLQYSRDRYADDTYQRNPDGGVTSFMGAINDAPGGGYFNHPTFWVDPGAARGRVIDPRIAAQRALQWEAANGKQFARAASPMSSELGEMLTHLVMDQDAERMRGGR